MLKIKGNSCSFASEWSSWRSWHLGQCVMEVKKSLGTFRVKPQDQHTGLRSWETAAEGKRNYTRAREKRGELRWSQGGGPGQLAKQHQALGNTASSLSSTPREVKKASSEREWCELSRTGKGHCAGHDENGQSGVKIRDPFRGEMGPVLWHDLASSGVFAADKLYAPEGTVGWFW